MGEGRPDGGTYEIAAPMFHPYPAATGRSAEGLNGSAPVSLATQALVIEHGGASRPFLTDAMLSESATLAIAIATVALIGWRRLRREAHARAREQARARARHAAATPSVRLSPGRRRNRGRGRIGPVPSL